MHSSHGGAPCVVGLDARLSGRALGVAWRTHSWRRTHPRRRTGGSAGCARFVINSGGSSGGIWRIQQRIWNSGIWECAVHKIQECTEVPDRLTRAAGCICSLGAVSDVILPDSRISAESGRI